MGFKMINDEFKCENCGKSVSMHPDGSARNHCPFCLYSKHVDKEFPGDRMSVCFGLMRPIGIEYKKNKGYMIRHSCIKCSKEMLNKTSSDDAFQDFANTLYKNERYI